MTIQEKNRQLEILKKLWRFQIKLRPGHPHPLLVDHFFSCFEEVFDVQKILEMINSPNGLDKTSILSLHQVLKTDYDRDVPSWFLEKGYPPLVVDVAGGRVEIGEFQQYRETKLFEDYSPEEKTDLTLYNFSKKSLHIYIGALEEAIRECVQESLRSQEQRGGQKRAGEIEESDVEDLDSAAKEEDRGQAVSKRCSRNHNLTSYAWLKRGDGGWLAVFEGEECAWERNYKALANIRKLLENPREEFDAYGLSEESEQPVGPGSVDIRALIEEGLSISVGPMSSGAQKMTTPEARQLIKKTILELKEERTTTTDPDRKTQIDESLRALDKTRKKIINQFPDIAKGIKTIKTGIDRLIDKIKPGHPKLAEHLESSIKRRNNCLVYEPTRKNIAWVTRNPT